MASLTQDPRAELIKRLWSRQDSAMELAVLLSRSPQFSGPRYRDLHYYTDTDLLAVDALESIWRRPEGRREIKSLIKKYRDALFPYCEPEVLN